jgi:hypothetical protein
MEEPVQISASSNQFPDDAFDWAQNYFAFSIFDRVANHKRANTYKLSGLRQEGAYLKHLTTSTKGTNLAIESISHSFRPHVPDLIRADAGNQLSQFPESMRKLVQWAGEPN